MHFWEADWRDGWETGHLKLCIATAEYDHGGTHALLPYSLRIRHLVCVVLVGFRATERTQADLQHIGLI
jgi:hypothetical protein